MEITDWLIIMWLMFINFTLLCIATTLKSLIKKENK